MKKAIIAAILIAGCYQNSYAQAEATVEQKKVKCANIYVGVQLNALIRQVFNFNNNVNNNNNPYQLVLSVNSVRTGWGVRLGAGYNHNSSSTNDGITNTNTNINELRMRLGGEKLFRLSNKWSAGAGLDFVYNTDDDQTVNTINSSFGNPGQTVETSTIGSTLGFGTQAWLRYHITDRVLIGTEASFYYLSGSETRSMTITSGGFPGGNQPDQTNNISQGTFNSPVAFFILVKI